MSEGQLNNPYAGRPSVCRNCGALVGAGESVCGQCGAAVAGVAQAGQVERQRPPFVHDRDTIRFARAVLGRPYVFTIIFLIANFFVFLLMWHSTGLNKQALLLPSGPVLTAYGAKLNWLINQKHEWWRFVTPIFIHVGIVHLLVNMYSLWMVGPYVEKLYGSAKFVVFWVVTGVAGVAASYLTVRPDLHVSGPIGKFLFKAMDTPSAGASGALFGLVGVLFVFGIKFRRELPEGFKRAFGTGLLPTIMINLFIGYLGSGFIDNAAHMGGFLSGCVLALVVGYKRPGERAGVAVFWHVLQVAALALVAVSFLMVVRHFPRQLPPSAETAAGSLSLLPDNEAQKFVVNLNTINEGQTALYKILDEKDASRSDQAIAALDDAPHLDAETDALKDELKALLVRAKEFAEKSRGPKRDQAALAREQRKIFNDFEAWNRGYVKWTDAESEKHGIKLKEESPSK